MTAQKFITITIIYNPNSTGDSKHNAQALKTSLGSKSIAAKLVGTKHAGHAEEIAYKAAKEAKRALVISSSGDGGYNEVVNGLLRAQSEGATPTCGLLPSGNANDHYNALSEKGEMLELIIKGKSKAIDVLVMNVESSEENWQRYAHSYIGVGITAHAGRELNKIKVNILNEAWIVWKSLMNIQPVHVQIGNKSRAYTSLIFSNINRMSKLFSFSADSGVTDGKFEVTRTYNESRWRLFNFILRALHSKRDVAFSHEEKFIFITKRSTPVQLDGEVRQLTKGDKVTITMLHKALNCLV